MEALIHWLINSNTNLTCTKIEPNGHLTEISFESATSNCYVERNGFRMYYEEEGNVNPLASKLVSATIYGDAYVVKYNNGQFESCTMEDVYRFYGWRSMNPTIVTTMDVEEVVTKKNEEDEDDSRYDYQVGIRGLPIRRPKMKKKHQQPLRRSARLMKKKL